MPRYKAPEPRAWYAVECRTQGKLKIGGGGRWPDTVSFYNLGVETGEQNVLTTDKGWALDCMATAQRKHPNVKYRLMVVGPATVENQHE